MHPFSSNQFFCKSTKVQVFQCKNTVTKNNKIQLINMDIIQSYYTLSNKNNGVELMFLFRIGLSFNCRFFLNRFPVCLNLFMFLFLVTPCLVVAFQPCLFSLLGVLMALIYPPSIHWKIRRTTFVTSSTIH